MYATNMPSRNILFNGKEYLFFSGTAYLGMHARPEFGALVWEGIQRYGTNYGASRLGNIGIPVFDQAEEKMAKWLGAPSAVMVSSGTLAGRLILEALEEYEPHFSPNAHIAINPKYKKHQPHLFDAWMEKTIQDIGTSESEKHLITFNSIDSLTASQPGLDWIDNLPKDKDILLIADDSHGIGVMGEDGRGIYPELINRHPHSILIASLGKAMGLPAGLIAGPATFIIRAKSHPLFGGSSPMVPAYAYAYLHSDQIYEKAYKELKRNFVYFKNQNSISGIFTSTDQAPIFCTARHELATYLENNGIRISHFAYPSPADDLYTRIVLNGLHTLEDMNQLIGLVKTFIN